jgi:glycine/D-amino acid oxidase-like deaminating enzyme
MRSSLSVDYIIVGQGLAGSTLAIQLIKRGKRFLVIDAPDQNSASRVAAGLFNPVTGNKLVKSWLTDLIFPYLHTFYADAEKLTSANFYHPMPLYRPFVSIEEQNEWMGRSTDQNYSGLIERIITKSNYSSVNDPFGGLLLKQSGYIDTQNFINAVRSTLIERDAIWEIDFDHEKLVIEDTHVTYEHVKATAVIFCEGVKVSINPWFNKLPITALKGETLTIKCDWHQQVILNRGVYLVPEKRKGEFKVGATYNFQDKSAAVTMEGKVQLETKLRDLVSFPYTATNQQWGFRPTTNDRRPIIGRHPKFTQLIIFNGLGTKGVSLAPYFSEALLQWTENAIPLYKEVDITRYKMLY